MYCTITPNKSLGARHFINYLDKEDLQAAEIIQNDEKLSEKFADYLNKENDIEGGEKDLFFNGENYNIDKNEVVTTIENNRKGLKVKESNFFSLTFNPSAKELEQINKFSSEEAANLAKAGIGNFEENREWLTRDLLKKYTERCMDEYARNFGREGINSSKDIVWFGKVERDRYWKWKDKEVIHNRKILSKISKLEKQGKIDEIETLRKELILESGVRTGGKDIPVYEMMPKNGVNYHVHVIVSRRDKEQKVSLSPLAKARSNNEHKINGRTCKIGFNRDVFAQKIEVAFDKEFDYDRQYIDSYLGRKTLKLEPEKYREKAKEFYQDKRENLQVPSRSFDKNEEIDIHGVRLSLPVKLAKSQVKKAALGLIKEETTPYKKFLGYGNMTYSILQMKGGELQQQRVRQLVARMCLDYMNAASLGAIPVSPLQIVVSGGKMVKELMVGKEQPGMEK